MRDLATTSVPYSCLTKSSYSAFFQAFIPLCSPIWDNPITTQTHKAMAATPNSQHNPMPPIPIPKHSTLGRFDQATFSTGNILAADHALFHPS
jgi:hypothetical protein